MAAKKWPKYCGPRKDRGNIAYCWHKGKKKYFPGAVYGSAESVKLYEDFCRKHYTFATDKEIRTPTSPTVMDLLCKFDDFAASEYKKSPKELEFFRTVGHLLGRLFQELPVDEFHPTHLKEFRQKLIDNGYKSGKGRKKYSVTTINKHIRRVVRIFSWGVTEGIVMEPTVSALERLPNLRNDRAPEGAVPARGRTSVDWDNVKATIDAASPTLAAMIEIQWLTGMRSDNLVRMKGDQIDRDDSVWLYFPQRHKGQWRGKTLVVPLGPRCQEILAPLIARKEPSEFLFAPRDAAQWRREQRRIAAGLDLTPGGKLNPRYRDAYDSHSYAQAVDRARKRAGVDKWTPHQLRHARVTEIEKEFDIEAARVYIGHSSIKVTNIYAHRDLLAAKEIARKIG